MLLNYGNIRLKWRTTKAIGAESALECAHERWNNPTEDKGMIVGIERNLNLLMKSSTIFVEGEIHESN